MRSNRQQAQSAFRRFISRQQRKHDWLFLSAVAGIVAAVLIALMLSPTLSA